MAANERVDELARIIWDYMLLHHQLKKADVIIVPGSLNTTPARRAAELFHQGWAHLILMSGGLGRVTKDHFQKSEAEIFAEIATDLGVPRKSILTETKSTSIGENILFSRQLLEGMGIKPRTVIIVQKPYTERRIYAAFKKQWPGPEYIVTSPQVSYDDWSLEAKKGGRFIAFLVGDLQRIIIYPKKGWQIPQVIPDDVLRAYQELIDLGYTEHLFKEE